MRFLLLALSLLMAAPLAALDGEAKGCAYCGYPTRPPWHYSSCPLAARGGGPTTDPDKPPPRFYTLTPAEEAFNRGVDLKKAGRLEEAVDAYLESLRLDPSDPAAWTNLGNVYWDLGRRSEARSAYQRALQEKPGYRNAKKNLASLEKTLEGERFSSLLEQFRTLSAAGDFRGALSAIRSVVEIRPEDVQNRVCLAWALQMTGDLDGAEREYRTALKRDARNADARTRLLELLKSQSSASSLRKALELDPKDAPTRAKLGGLLLEAGEYGKAEAELRRALALAPADPLARLHLGHALLAQDKVDAGREAIETVLRTGYTGPQAAPAARALGKIYAKEAETLLAEGNEEEARRYLSSAAVLNPEDAGLPGRLEGLRAEDGARRTERVRKRVSELAGSGSWMGAARGAAVEGHTGDVSAVFDTPGMNIGGPAGVDLRGVEPAAAVPEEALEDPGIRHLTERRDRAWQEAKGLEKKAETLRRDPSPAARAELKKVEPQAEKAKKKAGTISIFLDKAVLDAARKKGKP